MVDEKNRNCKVFWSVKVQVILLFVCSLVLYLNSLGKRLKDIGIIM